MEQGEDRSILIADKNFQRILLQWETYTEDQKKEIYQEYDLQAEEVDLLKQLWYSLDFRKFDQPHSVVEKALEETWEKISKQGGRSAYLTVTRRIYIHFARIAALLILPLLLYTAYLQFYELKKSQVDHSAPLVSITSQAGTITKLALPDGSQVYLNAGSRISYPTQFGSHERKVILEGEGYFEVVKNKAWPMVVSAGNVNLKVYGTSFNVNAYHIKDFVKVTLVEGSVALTSSTGQIDGQHEFFITPGQTVTYDDASKNLTLQNEDPFLYTAWKDGIMVFRNKTFENVLKQLSCKFNVDIELKDKTLALIPMDATFRDENINEVLRLLSLSTPFKFYYDDSRKLQDGTYAKSKIIIDRK